MLYFLGVLLLFLLSLLAIIALFATVYAAISCCRFYAAIVADFACYCWLLLHLFLLDVGYCYSCSCWYLVLTCCALTS